MSGIQNYGILLIGLVNKIHYCYSANYFFQVLYYFWTGKSEENYSSTKKNLLNIWEIHSLTSRFVGLKSANRFFYKL